MKSPTPLRLLIDAQPNRGSWNMAVDEALLESALQNGISTVRVYRWEEATLSLGYFQNPADVADDRQLSALPMVRRLSGGGAIVHHHELTYSFALAPRQIPTAEPTQLYAIVHTAIINWLKQHGVDSAMRGAPPAANPSQEEAFLCFSRGDPHDVVIDGSKILGSAQRRRRGAVLQHGSLVLRTSPFAGHLPGLFELAGDLEFNDAGSEAGLGAAIASSLCDSATPGSLSLEERKRSEQLERERYRSVDAQRPRR